MKTENFFKKLTFALATCFFLASAPMAFSQTTAEVKTSVDMSALDVSKISAYTATDITLAYQNFLNHVKANKDSYNNNDWKVVEIYWDQLDNRKNAVQAELTADDKETIAVVKTEYQAIKNASKAANTGVKVGHAAKETGKDIGRGAKKAGKAVGNTAKKGAKKVEKAFDNDDK